MSGKKNDIIDITMITWPGSQESCKLFVALVPSLPHNEPCNELVVGGAGNDRNSFPAPLAQGFR